MFQRLILHPSNGRILQLNFATCKDNRKSFRRLYEIFRRPQRIEKLRNKCQQCKSNSEVDAEIHYQQ